MLAVGQTRLLCLTARKADVEFRIGINAQEKMALVREQTNLSKKYQSMLQAKQISYYANGKYNKMTYGYLMGYGTNYKPITTGSAPIKEQNSMILTDYNGLVVMSGEYASVLSNVLGSGCLDSKGRGGTFSQDKIPEIISQLLNGMYDAELIKEVMNGGTVDSSYSASVINALTGESTGQSTTVDTSEKATEALKKIIDFYVPIFKAAAANGWTTEYNEEMKHNDNYLCDAVASGTLQLAQVDEYGTYDPETSLNYFVMNGQVSDRSDAEYRQQITAWYNTEKELINEKEGILDITQQDLSTELESIKTMMESIKKCIQNGIEMMSFTGRG